MLVGAQVAGWIFEQVVTGDVEQALPLWANFWWIPAVFAAVVLVFFAIFFRGGIRERERVTVPPLTPEPGA
jgi:hypothetical protein